MIAACGFVEQVLLVTSGVRMPPGGQNKVSPAYQTELAAAVALPMSNPAFAQPSLATRLASLPTGHARSPA